MTRIWISCPKKKECQPLIGFRPIALCNVIYKVVAKILTNKLPPLLESNISPHHATFIPNKQILDNLVVTQELVHTMSEKSSKTKFFALKVDMSKA